MKTGIYPMVVKLKLFFKWGIQFGEPFELPDRGNREVKYAGKTDLQDEIFKRYFSVPENEPDEMGTAATDGGMAQTQFQSDDPPEPATIRTQKADTD